MALKMFYNHFQERFNLMILKNVTCSIHQTKNNFLICTTESISQSSSFKHNNNNSKVKTIFVLQIS